MSVAGPIRKESEAELAAFYFPRHKNKKKTFSPGILMQHALKERRDLQKHF